jgi:lipopolysaccharide biosynthesis glycosyltransferase
MIGVTIGIGGLWPEIAARSARRMAKQTGLECVALTGMPTGIPKVPHPSWVKCHIATMFPDRESFLVFDADIFALQSWNPDALFRLGDGYFTAVPDRNLPSVYQECIEHKLPFPDWYLNAGLTMFGRWHQQGVWDEVWKRQPKYGRWLEQTALNKALQGGDVHRLPRVFNKLPDVIGAPVTAENIRMMTAGGVINFHYADCGGDGAPILALQKELGYD